LNFEAEYLKIQTKQRVSITKINWSVLFEEIIAVYSENLTKPVNTLCGQNAELLALKVVVHVVTTGL
jgi:hypothetical protein